MKKLIIVSILSLIFSLNTYSQRLYEEQALEVGIKSINNFREFLSLKNDANYKTELEPLIQWGIDNFQKYGFDIERLETPRLPLLLASKIISKKTGILRNLPKTFEATRYHSLIIDKKSLSKDLEITAETKDGLIMGVRHKKYHVHGVQFHPESIKTRIGIKILKNFINI